MHTTMIEIEDTEEECSWSELSADRAEPNNTRSMSMAINASNQRNVVIVSFAQNNDVQEEVSGR